MKLCLLGKDRIETIIIPDSAEENASFVKTFNGQEDYTFSIELVEKTWYLKSNNVIHVLNDGTPVNKVVLSNYRYYIATSIGTNKQFFLYALPDKDKNVFNLDIGNLTKISIGNNQSCDIVYNNTSFTIEKSNNSYILNCPDSNIMVYVNNKAASNQQIIKTGDVIFSNGLRIIFMGKFININNPNNSVHTSKLASYTIGTNNTDFTQSNEDVSSISLYNETDYFYHTLRMDNSNSEVKVTIDPPPGSEEVEDLPFLLSFGSSITMFTSSIVMSFSLINQLQSSNSTLLGVLPTIIMLFGMIVGSLIMPKLLKNYHKKKVAEREALRLKMYTEYLDKKQAEINEARKKQEQNLRDNNPSTFDCYQLLTESEKINNIKFWSRRVTDNDFATIRLGLGKLKSQIVMNAPEKRFSLDKDNLLERAYEVAKSSQELTNVPITVSLLKNNVTGVILSSYNESDYINNLVLQLITLHSPNDLKIIVFTNEANERKWDYIKYLPHCWSDDKEVRFFATTKDEMENVSIYLEEQYKSRQTVELAPKEEGIETQAEKEKYDKKDIYKSYETYYLLINDDYNLAKDTLIVDLLTKTSINFGFSYLCIGEKMKELPSVCKAFVELRDKKGVVIENEMIENNEVKKSLDFDTEYVTNINMRYISDKLANVPIMTKDGISSLPNSLSFLEMLKVSKIEQLDSLNRWKSNNPVTSLSAVIGVHANGDDFKLDLHEKFHGPHGLIAGSTGSGKSEFIITYILSMAINYHPYEVQFVLIDYKGGGLAGAFENKETGVRIPHLVGTITNLDTAEMNRTLVSIQSELKRRQRVFNEVRDRLDEGTIDIYKYQRLYREGVVEEPMAHLFIISDEFAELKAQQPEFMDQLIQTARIGRSLGVHLILATQKPSGVVNDQIWSNSRFKVSLKVQERSDSMEMLKRPEAASIKEAGRFYLLVGYNDYFDIGQSGWSGAKYLPSDRVIKKVDDSINFVNNVGYKFKSIKDTVKVDNSVNYGEQLTNIVKYIYNLGIKESINTNKLWLDALPSTIDLSSLKKRYNYRPTPYFINPVIGEYDNPDNQEQGILNINLTKNGNTIIYGQTGSGKESLLSTIIWSCMAEHTPDEINMYVIDCGAETLKMFNNIPQVGEVATIEDSDLVYDIFNMLHDEIEKRKDLFSDYAGSYIEYCNNSGSKLPLIVTIINNYEIFVENFSKLAENVKSMYRDGSKYGIVFIMSTTAANSVGGRITQYFNNKICLQMPNDGEYRDILGAPRGKTPSNLYGRGMIAMNDTAYEFQTATFTESKNMVNVVRNAAIQLNNAYTTRAKKIPVIPKQILLSEFLKEEYNLKNVPIGYDIDTKMISRYNFSLPVFSILAETITMEKFSFIKSIIELLSKLDNTKIRIVDFEKVYENINPNNILWNDNYDNAFVEIYNEIMKNKNTSDEYYYLFFGIGDIRKKVSGQCMEIVERIFNSLPETTNCHLLLIDSYQTYKNLQLEPWYQTSINPMNGIWLGNGVQNQLAINMPKLTMDDKNLEFLYQAYAVENGNYVVIKHVSLDEEARDEG